MKTYASFIIHTDDIPGGPDAILGPSGCTKDVDEVTGMGTIYLDLEVHDERIAKLTTLLEALGKDSSPAWYYDAYTEDERQAAPLLFVYLWRQDLVMTGPEYGVKYDLAFACPTCHTGLRQASPLIIDGSYSPNFEKYLVRGTSEDDLLLRDTDIEKLLAANVTGANFWPITAKYKNGTTKEPRMQQALIENVLPPLAQSTQLVEEGICPTCSRGRKSKGTKARTHRYTYRREDLKNICDFNLSWEWFGPYGNYGKTRDDDGGIDYRRPYPWIFITPKVMNVIRAKTKKEEKYQGCGFVPVWIEDENGRVSLETKGK